MNINSTNKLNCPISSLQRYFACMLTLAMIFPALLVLTKKLFPWPFFLSKGKLSQYAINVVPLISGPWLQHQ